MSICRLVGLSVGWSVGPSILNAFVLAGRDKPANDLFRVYELVLNKDDQIFFQAGMSYTSSDLQAKMSLQCPSLF